MLDCVRELGVAMAKGRDTAVASMGSTENEIGSLVRRRVNVIHVILFSVATYVYTVHTETSKVSH